LLFGSTFLVWGQRFRAEEEWGELDELAQRTGYGNTLIASMLAKAILATLDGRLEDAVATGQSISTRREALGISGFSDIYTSFYIHKLR
jgi:hypothetical protein